MMHKHTNKNWTHKVKKRLLKLDFLSLLFNHTVSVETILYILILYPSILRNLTNLLVTKQETPFVNCFQLNTG
jgi:hypothetical protein